MILRNLCVKVQYALESPIIGDLLQSSPTQPFIPLISHSLVQVSQHIFSIDLATEFKHFSFIILNISECGQKYVDTCYSYSQDCAGFSCQVPPKMWSIFALGDQYEDNVSLKRREISNNILSRLSNQHVKSKPLAYFGNNICVSLLFWPIVSRSRSLPFHTLWNSHWKNEFNLW